MLIFGFGVKDVLLTTLMYVCENCGTNAAHHLLKRVRRFSLFFIPLFPIGTRYVDICTNCGRMIDVPRERAEAAAMGTGPGWR